MMEGDIIKPRPVAAPRPTLHNVSYWLIVIALFVLLVAPPLVSILPLELVKRLGFAILVAAALIFWLLGSLQKNRLAFPRSLLLASLGFLGLVSVASAFLAPDLTPALKGVALEVAGTWFFWLVLVATFLVSTFFQSIKQIFRWYGFLFIGFIVVFFFQVIQLFFPAFTRWSNLTGGAGNLFGSWADLGYFFGFVSLSLFLILEWFDLGSWRYGRLVIGIMSGLALLGAAFTGMVLVWWILAVMALLVFVRSFLQETPSSGRNFRRLIKPSSVLLFIAVIYLIFAYSQNTLGNPVAGWYQKTNVQLSDVRPTWGATWRIFSQNLKEDKIHFWFGAGPNGFADQWVKYRSIPASPDPFSDLEFESGSSFIPTSIINTGVAGIVAWFIFFVFLFWSIWKVRCQPPTDPMAKESLKLLIVGVLYLWIAMWTMVPGSSLVVLTFLMTGVLVGYLVGLKYHSSYRFVFSRQAMAGSLVVAIVVGLLILSLINFYFIGRNSYAWSRYGQIVKRAQSDQTTATTLEQLLSLRRIHHNEAFDRLTVTVANARIVELAKENLPIDALRNNLQAVISSAIGVAQQAISGHKNNYTNWVALGSIYETVIPLKVERSAEAAEQAYLQAAKFNPTSASVLMNLARLYISIDDQVKARSAIDRALQVQPFSVPVIITASQFDAGNTETSKALNRLEQATMAIPNDARLWFSLGYLRYTLGRYETAVEALRQAIRYNPTVPEFHYFFALALGKTGNRGEALKELNLLLAVDPNNKTVKDAISSLQR
jgi:tetratricopeptide (TPR) repeat protein